MKKLFFLGMSIVLVAACSNKSSEDSAAVTSLQAWMDSVSQLEIATPDSATLAGLTSEFEAAVGGIDSTKLGEAEKMTLSGITSAFANFSESFNTKIEEAKAAAMMAADTSKTDSSAMGAAQGMMDKAKEVVGKVKEEVKK
jgi:hypothetical protein